jgi:hypothetical protein
MSKVCQISAMPHHGNPLLSQVLSAERKLYRRLGHWKADWTPIVFARCALSARSLQWSGRRWVTAEAEPA